MTGRGNLRGFFLSGYFKLLFITLIAPTYLIYYLFFSSTNNKIIVSSPDIVLSIAADESHIYWSTTAVSHFSNGYEKYTGAIWHANLDGSNANTIATGVSPIEGLFIDSLNVYWRDRDGISKVSKSGGAIRYLTSDLDFQYGRKEIVVDDTFVYFNLCSDGESLMKVNKSGGELINLVQSQDCATEIAIDEEYIYWLEGFSHASIKRMLKTGSQPITLIDDLAGVTDLVVDENYIYWSIGLTFFDDYDNTIMYMPKNGGSTVILSEYQTYADHLVVHAGRAYWAIQPFFSLGYTVNSKSVNDAEMTTYVKNPQLSNIGNIAINDSSIFVIQDRGLIVRTRRYDRFWKK